MPRVLSKPIAKTDSRSEDESDGEKRRKSRHHEPIPEPARRVLAKFCYDHPGFTPQSMTDAQRDELCAFAGRSIESIMDFIYTFTSRRDKQVPMGKKWLIKMLEQERAGRGDTTARMKLVLQPRARTERPIPATRSPRRHARSPPTPPAAAPAATATTTTRSASPMMPAPFPAPMMQPMQMPARPMMPAMPMGFFAYFPALAQVAAPAMPFIAAPVPVAEVKIREPVAPILAPPSPVAVPVAAPMEHVPALDMGVAALEQEGAMPIDGIELFQPLVPLDGALDVPLEMGEPEHVPEPAAETEDAPQEPFVGANPLDALFDAPW